MKIFKITLFFILLFCLFSCDEKTNTTDKNIQATKFIFEGHRYIQATKIKNPLGITHDPDCHCNLQITIKTNE